jgi:hypothetical protein
MAQHGAPINDTGLGCLLHLEEACDHCEPSLALEHKDWRWNTKTNVAAWSEIAKKAL